MTAVPSADALGLAALGRWSLQENDKAHGFGRFEHVDGDVGRPGRWGVGSRHVSMQWSYFQREKMRESHFGLGGVAENSFLKVLFGN